MSGSPPSTEWVQPGQRGLFPLERFVGRCRRAYLRRFRPGYVEKMAALRTGDCQDCAHDVIDSRDLKLVRNSCGFSFPPESDPFAWRDRLPFARQGLIEVVVIGGGGIALAACLAFFEPWLAAPPLLVSAFYFWFFRDPVRDTSGPDDLVTAPCDGRVDDICEVDHCEALGGPATRIGISLSLFDVHLNRCPLDGVVADLRYHPGIFKNAQRKGDHSDNEQFWSVLQPAATTDRIAIRQIAGPMARTIVNELRQGTPVRRGQKIGMIKFGSRTELYFPRTADRSAESDDAYRIVVEKGARVRGGVTPLLRFSALP